MAVASGGALAAVCAQSAPHTPLTRLREGVCVYATWSMQYPCPGMFVPIPRRARCDSRWERCGVDRRRPLREGMMHCCWSAGGSRSAGGAPEHDSGTMLNNVNVLVLDATNILCKCFVSRPYHDPKDVFDAWLEYLKRVAGAEMVVCVFDNPSASADTKTQDGYLRRRRRRQGVANSGARRKTVPIAGPGASSRYMDLVRTKGPDWSCIVSNEGEEADETIGDVVLSLQHILKEKKKHECHHVYVASSDGDMQQYIDDTVSWLNILPVPTKKNPLGLEIVDIQNFALGDYFHPSKYPEYLCLVGKQESSVGGVGVGPKTAAKLLRSFGDLETLERAATAGILTSWNSNVQKVFLDEKTRKKLERNKRIFMKERCTTDLGNVVESWLCDHISSNHQPAQDFSPENHSKDVYWEYPFHKLRWRTVGPFCQQVAEELENRSGEAISVSVRGVFRNVPVDIIMFDGNSEIGLLIVIPVLARGGENSPTDIATSILSDIQQPSSLLDMWKLQNSMPSTMARHISSLLKCELNIVYVPFYIDSV